MTKDPTPSTRDAVLASLAAALALPLVLGALAWWLLPLGSVIGLDNTVEETEEWVRSFGAWGVAGSIALMVAHSFLPFPSEIIAIANGMLYGPLWGSVITWVGAMLGATIAFGLVRVLGRPFLFRMLSPPRLQQIERWSRERGGVTLLISRLIPLIAFNLLNYGAALTGISWWTFLWATGIGILPLTILLAVVGDRALVLPLWIWVALGAAVLACWLAIRRWRPGAGDRLPGDESSERAHSPLLTGIGEGLAKYLSTPIRQASQVAIVSPELLAATLRPGDVLLVDGNSRISVAIKYLTQSTWSHAALFVGDTGVPGQDSGMLIEADIRDGVRLAALGEYAGMHTRICRPVGLSPDDVRKVIGHAVGRIGHRYDLKNVMDLARYLVPTPPVPVRWRRRLIAFGSGDPSRAICSTMIAQAFQSVRYPILPEMTLEKSGDAACSDCYREVLHIRHHSLFTPRDFDISPYFEVVKPSLLDFDYRQVEWAAADPRTLSPATP